MNLLKALQVLSPDKTSAPPNPETPPAAEVKPDQTESGEQIPNVMAGVLERHERISNRVRSGTNRGN